MTGNVTVSRRTFLAATAALISAGCARSAQRSASRADLVWVTGGIGPADQSPALDVAARWNALHPDGPAVRVEGLSHSADEQRQVLELELNANLHNFDILDLDYVWTAEFAQRGWLVDLQDLRADIDAVSLPGSVNAAVWEGTLWASPYTTDAGILYYRSDLVEEPPATWEQLVEIGRRVGGSMGMAPFVADGAQYEGLVVQYLEYLWGLGGSVLGEDGRQVTFPLDTAQKAVEFMRTAYREGVYAPGFNAMDLEGARKAFQSGEAVFMRSWPYAYREVNGGDPESLIAGKVGIAPLPEFTGHPPVTALGGHHLAVSAFGRNIPGAIEFVRFATTSREVQRDLARHSRAPTLRAAYHDLRGDSLMVLLARVLPAARPRPATTEWSAISAEMQQQIFAAYTGARQPRAAVEDLRRFLIATVGGD